MVINKTKYPRTFHLPWSEGATDDDKTHTLEAVEDMFGGKEVVITEKADGENTTIYSDGTCHARSLDSGAHKSRDYVKAKAKELGCMGLPEGWRLMGENMFAQHSISYNKLPDFFVLFGVADDANTARSWEEVEDWAALLEIPHVPVLYKGPWQGEKTMRAMYPFNSHYGDTVAEGYVVRVAGSFPMDKFSEHVAKFVRLGHVQAGSEHWMHKPVVPNTKLKLESLLF